MMTGIEWRASRAWGSWKSRPRRPSTPRHRGGLQRSQRLGKGGTNRRKLHGLRQPYRLAQEPPARCGGVAEERGGRPRRRPPRARPAPRGRPRRRGKGPGMRPVSPRDVLAGHGPNWSRCLRVWEPAVSDGPLDCLEIGCSTGGLSLWLASRGHAVDLLGPRGTLPGNPQPTGRSTSRHDLLREDRRHRHPPRGAVRPRALQVGARRDLGPPRRGRHRPGRSARCTGP